MDIWEQDILHDKINNFQNLSETEQKEIHNKIDELVSGSNGWKRIKDLFDENKHIQPYFLKAKNKVLESGNASLPVMMVITIKDMLRKLKYYKNEEEEEEE